MYINTLIQFFENTVARVPDRIAVVENDISITFKELHKMVLAEALAIIEVLANRTCQPIAVNLPKGINCIIADLAVLYSGNAYMNLDVKAPEARNNAILQNVQPALIIGDKSKLNYECSNFNISMTRDISENEKRMLYENIARIIDTDLCCLINTSGSTGFPKTVALTHRSYIDYTQSVMVAGLIGEDAIAGSMAPSVFDHFSFEVCLLMAAGCTLVLIPEKLPAFPIRLLEFIKEKKVDFIFWVPTIMVNIANMDLLSKIKLPDLKTVWFAGEVFPTAKFNYWRKNLSDVKFVNLYGPTEITVDCLYHIVKEPLPENEPIPIGKPFANIGIMVLDENNRVVDSHEPGIEGELCVRGSSLAAGYYNNPEQTARAFTQNPRNGKYPETIYRTGDIVAWNGSGELVFRGRRDAMIKHSGYRIELGEIEKGAFRASPQILNACAIYDREAKKIILFYEARQPLAQNELRKALMLYVPRYMVPHEFIHIEEMPRNVNGKIDRHHLADKYAKEFATGENSTKKA